MDADPEKELSWYQTETPPVCAMDSEPGKGLPRSSSVYTTESLALSNVQIESELIRTTISTDRETSKEPSSTTNPMEWSKKRKWTMVVVVSLFCFVPSLSSTILAPALPQVKRVLQVSSSIELQAIFSIFSLGYAVGPLLLAPLSDVHGRVRVLQLSNVVFLATNASCIAASTGTVMIVLRLLAGVGASAPLALGGGMIGETFYPEERGAAVAVYALAPIAGPTLGPILGAFLTEHCPLAYQFAVTSAASLFAALLGLLLLNETNPRVLEARKARGASRHAPQASPWKSVLVALRRPPRLLLTQPMAMLLCIYQSFLWGLLYLIFSVFIVNYTIVYLEPLDIASLHYLALFIGSLLGTQITALSANPVYRRLKARNRDVGKPEFRLPLLAAGTILLTAGLILLGLALAHKLSWVVADVGSVIFAAGNVMSYQALQTLMIDSYPQYAVAMLAAATLLRSIFTFAFPLLAPALFRTLGLGWGYTLVGLVMLCVGAIGILIIWTFGQRLRRALPSDF